MQPPQPPSKSAKPQFGSHFDPWNSVSTGHQRAEQTPGTGWRESRNTKLNSQFRASTSGGERLSDTWGAGSADYDERRKVLVPKSVRTRLMRGSVMDMLVKPGTMRESHSGSSLPATAAAGCHDEPNLTKEEELMGSRKKEDEGNETKNSERAIFDGLVIYVNGSTYPFVSDLKLKQLLTENGARMSLHVARRRVTHVIVGKTRAANGGLAGGKLEKEIKKIGGCGIKFVNVDWVLESIRAGKRLPEGRFATMKVAPKNQESAHSLFSRSASLTKSGN